MRLVHVPHFLLEYTLGGYDIRKIKAEQKVLAGALVLEEAAGVMRSQGFVPFDSPLLFYSGLSK
jgi:hypothetical protein